MAQSTNQIYLDLLIGYRVLNIDISFNEFYPIGESNINKEVTIVATIIGFECGFKLIIDNPHNLKNASESVELSKLVGRKLTNAMEGAKNITFVFENDLILTVDMRDEAYSSPEALCLYGPNNLCIVWN